MADRSLEGMALPLEVRARLAELELELSEGNRPGPAALRCRREAAAKRAGAGSPGRGVPVVHIAAPARAAACRRPAALRRGLGRGVERPAWRARVLVRVRALPPRPRLGTPPRRLACGALALC